MTSNQTTTPSEELSASPYEDGNDSTFTDDNQLRYVGYDEMVHVHQQVVVPALRIGTVYLTVVPPWTDSKPWDQKRINECFDDYYTQRVSAQPPRGFDSMQALTPQGEAAGYMQWERIQQSAARDAGSTRNADGDSDFRSSSIDFESGGATTNPFDPTVPGHKWLERHIIIERDQAMEGVDDYIHIGMLTVHPVYKREGYGRMLIERLLELEADPHRLPVFAVTEPLGGVWFFEKFGFRAHKQLRLPQGHLVVMIRPAPPAAMPLRLLTPGSSSGARS